MPAQARPPNAPASKACRLLTLSRINDLFSIFETASIFCLYGLAFDRGIMLPPPSMSTVQGKKTKKARDPRRAGRFSGFQTAKKRGFSSLKPARDGRMNDNGGRCFRACLYDLCRARGLCPGPRHSAWLVAHPAGMTVRSRNPALVKSSSHWLARLRFLDSSFRWNDDKGIDSSRDALEVVLNG